MSKRSQAKIVTRSYGARHRLVADTREGIRVTSRSLPTPETSSTAEKPTHGIGPVGPMGPMGPLGMVGGMIPMRTKLPSSMEPAKHDIDVPELPALAQVSDLASSLPGLAPGLGEEATAPDASDVTNAVSGLISPLDSGVYLAPDLAPDVAPATDVTLVVYSWHNVQPGVLSWIFPTARAALSAAYAMRNAVRWAIVRGTAQAEDLDLARLAGDVLIEHT